MIYHTRVISILDGRYWVSLQTTVRIATSTSLFKMFVAVFKPLHVGETNVSNTYTSGL